MDWQVDGADRETGEDKAFLITADTEGEARAIGEAQNIYVSAVVPYVNPDYTPPAPEPEPEPAYVAPPPPQPKRRTPPPPSAGEYVAQQQQLAYARPGASAAANTFADVPGAARRLRAADWVLSIVGLLYIVVGVVLGIIGLIAQLRVTSTFGFFDFSFLLVALAMIAGGVLLLGAGAAMRMVASIGIATAEIARRKS